VYWGAEEEWLATSDKPHSRYSGERDLDNPLAAVQMGLIYVNPEGPDGQPIPAESAHDVRTTFARMAMNDEETVALVAGGHTFGKCHGAGPATHGGPEPEAAPLEEMGLGWKSDFKSGKGVGHHQQRHRRRVETQAHHVGHGLPQGAVQIRMGAGQEPGRCLSSGWPRTWTAGRHGRGRPRSGPKRSGRMMTTADLSLKFDPIYEKIAKRYLANPEEFADAFARAWFKLTHRDMGPVPAIWGPEFRPRT
jgi:catalase-peroxidase